MRTGRRRAAARELISRSRRRRSAIGLDRAARPRKRWRGRPATPLYCAALVAAPDAKTAERIADALLEKRLAACVNRIDGIRSKYRWEGKIEESQEAMLVIKTRTELMPSVADCVKENHPYAVPEVIGLPIANGHGPYLDWLEANTQAARRRGGANTK